MTDLQVIRDISPTAQISSEASIGEFCIVGPDVTIGPDTALAGRVTVIGNTTIGSGNVIGYGSVLGAEPQDLKYLGQPTRLIIGHRNRLGKFITAHIGTEAGGYLTRIGDDNILDDGCHVAHDCYVDDRTRLGRDVQLAGHSHVQSGAVLEDMSGLHHFVTIGQYARVGRRTPVRRDVPPFTNFYSESYDWSRPPSVRSIHDEGIRTADLQAEDERELRHALDELFEDETALQTKIEQLVDLGVEGVAAELCRFCRQSLAGVYGRGRELSRGQAPPESEKYLPPEFRPAIRRSYK